jgi:hypothetical protein
MKSLEGYVGTACTRCGAVIAETDIKRYLEKVLRETAKGISDLLR